MITRKNNGSQSWSRSYNNSLVAREFLSRLCGKKSINWSSFGCQESNLGLFFKTRSACFKEGL
jgi:hypothetical protein